MPERFKHWLSFGIAIPLLLPVARHALGEVGGERGTSRRYVNTGPESKDSPEFSCDLDYIAFPLTTWQGKYRLVRVRISNASKTPVAFSSEKDSVQAHFARNDKVSAHLIPSAVVPELWDKLDAKTREFFAYPKVVAANSTIHVYLFFPSDKLTETPEGFSWNVASLEKTVSIYPRLAADR